MSTAALRLNVTDQTKPKIESLGEIELYGGRFRGRLVREAGPDGTGVEIHARNDTQREAERLFSLGRINHDQLTAANMIRDDNEIGRKQLKAASWTSAVDNSFASADPIIRAAAYEEYRLAMNQLGRDQRRIVEDVVINDMRLEDWARRWRCHGDGLLTTALDRLAKHYERSGR